nr:diguanylate cyclase [uncultured Duganella sp.]
MTPAPQSIAALVRRGQWRSVLVALGCATALMGGVALYGLQQQATHALSLAARSLAYAGEPALRFKDTDALMELVKPLADSEQLATVEVLDRRGEVLLHYRRPPAGHHDALARRVAAWLLPMSVSAPVAAGARPLGEVRLSSDGRVLLDSLAGLLAAVLSSLALSAVAAWWWAHRLARLIVEPVSALVRLTKELREHRRFDSRADIGTVVEINTLAEDFNHLLTELQSHQDEIAERHEELSSANLRLRHTSLHDGLTGLPNRRYLVEHLREMLARCRSMDERAAVLFIDMDRFKQVNDSMGHAVGDVLLETLAQRLRASVRETDFVARQGGDEFVVLLYPIGDSDDVLSSISRIRQSLLQPLRLEDGQILPLGVTIGGAIYPDHGDSIDALVSSADSAMYVAKSRARGSDALFQPQVIE